jgi:hypothetical protein
MFSGAVAFRATDGELVHLSFVSRRLRRLRRDIPRVAQRHGMTNSRHLRRRYRPGLLRA